MQRREVLALLALAPWSTTEAAGYPDRQIRLIDPFSPGSTSDATGRLIAQQLTPLLKQTVFVDNRPGADGRVGLLAARNAAPDGYTLLLASWSNLTVNPVIFKELPYDPINDFVPISGATRSMLGIAVPRNSKFKTLADLLAAAKAKPGSLTFGTFASGYLLASDWLANEAGVKFSSIPYKGSAQQDIDLSGGQIDAAMDGVSSLMPSLKSGQLRALAVTGDKRHPDLPNVPTIKESGFPNYSVYGWSGLYVRAGTAPDVVSTLRDAMSQVLTSPVTRTFSKNSGSEIMIRTPDEMKAFQAQELATFRRVAQSAGLTAQ